MNRILLRFVVLGGLVFSSAWAWAGDCCQRCGCASHVRKVCRASCETTKTPVIEYEAVCEDFCVPRPSIKAGKLCEPDCDGCSQCKTHWLPGCADVRTRVKLVPKTKDKEQKVYVWRVEVICEACACGKTGAASAPSPSAGVFTEALVPWRGFWRSK